MLMACELLLLVLLLFDPVGGFMKGTGALVTLCLFKVVSDNV
jgi:hypothetical protein